MAYHLIELSDTKSATGEHLVIIDYTHHFRLCRTGIWVGWETDFVETVVLSFEHDPDELYVGWALNGTIVSNPGFPPTIFPPGNPVPGAPEVRYMTPVGGFLHRISLTGTSAMAEACIYAQVLYTTFQDITQGKPITYGPSMTVCLRGSEITWPAAKLEAEHKCLRAWWERIHQVAGPVRPKPGDPVEDWLARLSGDEVVRLQGLVETLEQLDPGRDAKIVAGARAELQGLVDRLRMQGRIAGPRGARATGGTS